MKYKYKDNAFTKVKAQVVGETLEKIIKKNKGKVIPRTIVDAATPKRSPIHDCFEWDNSIAANKYRETQASYILRSVVIIHEYDDEDKEPLEVRAFVSVEAVEGGRYYTTINRAVQDEEIGLSIEVQAYNDYMALYHKYKDLKLFRQVHSELTKIKI